MPTLRRGAHFESGSSSLRTIGSTTRKWSTYLGQFCTALLGYCNIVFYIFISKFISIKNSIRNYSVNLGSNILVYVISYLFQNYRICISLWILFPFSSLWSVFFQPWIWNYIHFLESHFMLSYFIFFDMFC